MYAWYVFFFYFYLSLRTLSLVPDDHARNAYCGTNDLNCKVDHQRYLSVRYLLALSTVHDRIGSLDAQLTVYRYVVPEYVGFYQRYAICTPTIARRTRQTSG